MSTVSSDGVLTDCRDYDDRVKQSAGECPLPYVDVFFAIPAPASDREY